MYRVWNRVLLFLRKRIWMDQRQKRKLFVLGILLVVLVPAMWFQRGRVFSFVIQQAGREVYEMYLPVYHIQENLFYRLIAGIRDTNYENNEKSAKELSTAGKEIEAIVQEEKEDEDYLDSFYRENQLARVEQNLEEVKQGLEEFVKQEDKQIEETNQEQEEISLSEEKQTVLGRTEPVKQIPLEKYTLYEDLIRDFYTIDANTSAGKELLNVDSLMSVSMAIDCSKEGPQILLYHTHSQEGFVDSIKNQPETRIVGVGDELERILTEDYGYQVLHLRDEFDKKSRDDAYSNALPRIKEVLEEYPSIQAVIDLHRDEMPEGVRQVTEVDGKPTAKFMFFNGLSWSKKTGRIASLENPYLKENLALSFQMQVKANAYYPGLTRRIYLKQYRYNMHLCPKSMLIELGAQNNTLEEALNACAPLADLLNKVFSGE